MLTLEKVERMAGLAAHLPPCTDENYQVLAESYRTTLRAWRNELHAHLELLQEGAATEYKRRVLEILSGTREAGRMR